MAWGASKNPYAYPLPWDYTRMSRGGAQATIMYKTSQVIPLGSHTWEPGPWNLAWSWVYSIYSIQTCWSHIVDATLINFHGDHIYLSRGDFSSPMEIPKLLVCAWKKEMTLLINILIFEKEILTGTCLTKGLLKFFLVNWLQICLSVILIDYSTHTLKYTSSIQFVCSLAVKFLVKRLWFNPQRILKCYLKAASSSNTPSLHTIGEIRWTFSPGI